MGERGPHGKLVAVEQLARRAGLAEQSARLRLAIGLRLDAIDVNAFRISGHESKVTSRSTGRRGPR